MKLQQARSPTAQGKVCPYCHVTIAYGTCLACGRAIAPRTVNPEPPLVAGLCPDCLAKAAAAFLARDRPKPKAPQLVTVRYAARRLGVAPRTVRGYIGNGKLRALELGASDNPRARRYRLSLSEVLALLSEHRPMPPARNS